MYDYDHAAGLRARASEIRAVACGVSPGEDRDYFNELADALDAEAAGLEIAACGVGRPADLPEQTGEG